MAGSLVSAIYDFSKETHDDLEFRKGDFIKVIELISTEWMLGICNGAAGQFPSVFVKEVLSTCPTRVCFALNSYASQESEDLNFDIGQIITIEETVDDNWLKGHYDNFKGIFPKQFVKELDFSTRSQHRNGGSSNGDIAPQPQGKANSDFNAQSADELTIAKGSMISLKREVDGFWMEGEFSGKTGKFPSMFVDIVVPLPDNLRFHEDEEQKEDTNLEPMAKALFMYVGPTEKDLSFDKGDMITLMKKVGKDWFFGEIGKHQGIFPRNYVEIIRDLPFDPNDLVEPEAIGKKTVTNGDVVERKNSVETNMQGTRKHSAAEKPISQPRPRTLSLRKSLKKKKAPAHTKAEQGKQLSSPGAANPQQTLSDRVPLILGTSPTNSEPKPVANHVKAPPRKKRQAPKRPSATPNLQPKDKPNNDLLDSVDKESSSKLLKPLAPSPQPRERLGTLSKSASSQSIQRVSLDHTATSISDQREAKQDCSSPGLRRHNTLPVHKYKAPPRIGLAKTESASPSTNGSMPKSPLLPDHVSLDDKITTVVSQIEHENELLSGVLSMLELVDDEAKQQELTARRDSYSVSIDRLQDELSSLEDERSHTLAQFGTTDDLSVRIAEIERQIEMHGSSRSSLQKLLANADPSERQEIQENITFCTVMIEGLEDELKDLQDVLEEKKSPVPTKSEDRQTKMLANRMKVVKELLNTEISYVNDLKLCSTKVYSYLKHSKVDHINVDLIFGNLPVLHKVATEFLDAMQNLLTDLEHPDLPALAALFMKTLPDVKQRYAAYCRNYDDAQAWLEKYEDQVDVMEELANAVDTVRNETQCWDLSSFLIKPVQRILKYPLILQEILKTTPPEYPEQADLRQAVIVSSDIAKEINELKRRKDLVQKYQRPDGIGNKIQKLNWHSVRKKSSRINQKITRFTGLAHTIDETFNEEERKLRNLDRTLKFALKNVATYLECVQEHCVIQKNVAEDIREFYMDQASSEEVDAYHYVFLKLCEVSALQFVDHVQAKFVAPLSQLVNLLQSPFRLIQKRHDKLLDFDYHLKRAEKIKDKDKIGIAKEELVFARNNYEAMNAQLLEDLPPLIDKGLTLIRHCFIHLVKGHRAYVKQACELMEPLMKLGIMSPGRKDIIGRSGALMQRMADELAKLAFFPDAKEPKKLVTGSPYMKTSFYVDYTLMDSDHQNDPTSPMKPQARWLDDCRDGSETSSPKSSPSSPRGLGKKLINQVSTGAAPNENIYEVIYDFEAADQYEISVPQGAQVKVISKMDKKGNADWWLVEHVGKSGYIPQSYLDSYAPDLELDNTDQKAINVSPSDENTEYRIVEFDFEADNPGEIQLTEGDIVKVVSRSDLQGNGEWWLVKMDDKQGYVPANYLATIDDLAGV